MVHLATCLHYNLSPLALTKASAILVRMVFMVSSFSPSGLSSSCDSDVTSIELLIMQLTVTNKIMQCYTSKNNVLLSTSTETRDAFQNTPFLLQDSKRALNDISKGWMLEIEHLVLPLWRTPRTMVKFWNMICGSFERGKVSCSVWVTRIHKIIFPYKRMIIKTK